MGKIMVHEFISLDGVFENPSWTADYPFDPKMGEAISSLMGESGALLLGRKTFQMFAPAWSTRTAEDDPGAPFMNERTKHVVSSTLDSAEGWQNSTILGPYNAGAIGDLKGRVHGNIYVSGSGHLVRGMLEDELVDELHLFVYPVALGAGGRLFVEGDQARLALAETEAYDSGVVHLAYRPAG